MNDVELFVKCDCSSELLNLSKDGECGNLQISVWAYSDVSSSGTLPLLERFRYIWRILTKGKPYADQIILAPDKAQAVRDFLNKQYPHEMPHPTDCVKK